MKTWLKALLLSSAFVIALGIFLPSLLKLAINQLSANILTRLDIDSQGLHIDQLSWSRLQIKQANIALPAQNLNVEFENLDWHYSLLDLIELKLGRLAIARLNINQAQLTQTSLEQSRPKQTGPAQTSKPDTAAQTTAQQEINLVSVEQLFQQIPLEQLNIQQLTVNTPELKAQGHIFYDSQVFNIEQQLTHAKLNAPIKLELNINKNGEFFSQIYKHKKPEPILLWQGKLAAISNTGTSQLELISQQVADIQTWLTLVNSEKLPIKADVAVQTLNLNIKLPQKLVLSADNQQLIEQLKFNNSLQINVQNLSLPPMIEQASFNMQINNQIVDNQWLTFDIQQLDHQAKIQLALENQPALQLDHKIAMAEQLKLRCQVTELACSWQGLLTQQLLSKNGNKQQNLTINNQYQLKGELNLDQQISSGQKVSAQNIIKLDSKVSQRLSLWPQVLVDSHGEIAFNLGRYIEQGNKLESQQNSYDWQVHLPQGIISKIHYLDQSQGKVSPFALTLLDQFSLQSHEQKFSSSKLALATSEIQWQPIDQEAKTHNKISSDKQLTLEQTSAQCSFDWQQLLSLSEQQKPFTQLPVKCQLELSTAKSQWQKWPVPAAQVQFDISNQWPQLQSEIYVKSLNNKLDLQLNAQHNFEQNKGAAQLYLKDLAMNWSQLGLDNMPLLTKAQLLNGLMSAQGWLHWQQYQPDLFDDSIVKWRWQPDIMFRVDDFAGIYNGTTTWENMDFLMAVRKPLFNDFQIDAQLSAQTANAGIEVSNILARTSTQIPDDFSKLIINIQEVHADVLGGSIKIPLLTFDTSKSHNAFTIIAEHIDLAEMVKLEPQAGVKATGLLDGEIPVILGPQVKNDIIDWGDEQDLWDTGEPAHEASKQEISEKRSSEKEAQEKQTAELEQDIAGFNIYPVIEKGSLYARAPGGIVEYKGQTSDSLQQSNPMVKLAMKALENYHYEQLQTDISYQPDGALNLKLQFQGKNPDFFDGQATHFNLSLDYNLLDLLESLRISQDIVERVENKYK